MAAQVDFLQLMERVATDLRNLSQMINDYHKLAGTMYTMRDLVARLTAMVQGNPARETFPAIATLMVAVQEGLERLCMDVNAHISADTALRARLESEVPRLFQTQPHVGREVHTLLGVVRDQ